MEYAIRHDGEQLFVKVTGRLDAKTSPVLSDALADEFEGVKEVIFDLGDLAFVSSAGLRIFLASYKLMTKRDGDVRIVGADGPVLDVLKMSGFASLYGLE